MNHIKICLIALFVSLLALGCDRIDPRPEDSLTFRAELVNKYQAAGYKDVEVRAYKRADPDAPERMVCVRFEEETGFLSFNKKYVQCHNAIVGPDNLPAEVAEKVDEGAVAGR